MGGWLTAAPTGSKCNVWKTWASRFGLGRARGPRCGLSRRGACMIDGARLRTVGSGRGIHGVGRRVKIRSTTDGARSGISLSLSLSLSLSRVPTAAASELELI